MNWENTVAVITGAGTGIGKATKDLLRSKACTVYNLDFADNDSTDQQYFISCDVRNRQQVNDAIDKVIAAEKKIDFLFATLEQTSDEELQRVVYTNLFGVYYTLQKVIPIMKAQQKGSVVLMGSDQSFIGKAASSVYGMTKGAIAQLAKSTAIDYAPFNIRVNCICPGTIDTPLLHKAVDHFSQMSHTAQDEVYKSLDSIQPMGRIGKPEEIAKTVAFLSVSECLGYSLFLMLYGTGISQDHHHYRSFRCRKNIYH
jgi:NAD(P)-dependent dehydrogenase (short-subunit alcohol dehydrogenase family)